MLVGRKNRVSCQSRNTAQQFFGLVWSSVIQIDTSASSSMQTAGHDSEEGVGRVGHIRCTRPLVLVLVQVQGVFFLNYQVM